MDSSVKCAKDVDSAVKLALEDLQLGIDDKNSRLSKSRRKKKQRNRRKKQKNLR